MKRRQLVTHNEATKAQGQHVKPCGDCPWSRQALPGWLGSNTVDDWLQAAHGESFIECHTLIGAQCAGAAIYRGNVCKLPRDPDTLRLPANRATVFSNPMEFRKHHDGEK